jgi:hypothetical protein
MAPPVLNIRVDLALLRELRARADREGISVGDLARRYLREGLERPPESNDELDEDAELGAR